MKEKMVKALALVMALLCMTTMIAALAEDAGNEWYKDMLAEEDMLPEGTYYAFIKLDEDGVPVLVISRKPEALTGEGDKIAEYVNWEGDPEKIMSAGSEVGDLFYTNVDDEAPAESYRTSGATMFSIDANGKLIWEDAKAEETGNAGGDARPERGTGSGTPVNAFIQEGSFVVQIPVAEGDEGWMADDMSQDDSVVTLYDADILEETFVVRYDAAGDGDMAVCVKHMNGIACDEVYTWDLHVEDGAVRRFVESAHRAAPEEAELSGDVEGEWQVNDDVMAGMTLERNGDGGWAMEIRMAWPETRLYRANAYYDCELDEFVYEGGTLYEYEIDNTPEGRVGDEINSDISGSLELTTGEDGVSLIWYDSLNPEARTRFHRSEG